MKEDDTLIQQLAAIEKPLGYPPQILDPCCGGRMFYFDKHDPRVVPAGLTGEVFRQDMGKNSNDSSLL
ncbi:hypothetical protein [uncultured Desulfovibrio sp.]|uniref:hypothetical protein n=1 Tax=uncultured Desulfovibrio sp. TaxID=167968 RepID=UPI00258FBD93|nr:hypothetical protein [uncultured Desulfovibrio sp.]